MIVPSPAQVGQGDLHGEVIAVNEAVHLSWDPAALLLLEDSNWPEHRAPGTEA